MRPTVLVALPLLALAAFTAGAQGGTTPPRAVADSFFHLIADERFSEAAALMDIEAFDAYRRQNVGFARRRETPRTLTAAWFLRQDPHMPRAVAEYQAKAFNARVRDDVPGASREFGYATVDSLAAAPAVEALARWLRAHDMRELMRFAMTHRSANGCPPLPPEAAARLAQPIHQPPARIIGVVTDGDSVAWVLHDEPQLDFGAIIEPPAGHAAHSAPDSAPAVPLPPAPERPVRPWQEMAPGTTVLRHVGPRWLVGYSIGVGSSGGFSSFCEPARQPRARLH